MISVQIHSHPINHNNHKQLLAVFFPRLNGQCIFMWCIFLNRDRDLWFSGIDELKLPTAV